MNDIKIFFDFLPGLIAYSSLAISISAIIIFEMRKAVRNKIQGEPSFLTLVSSYGGRVK